MEANGRTKSRSRAGVFAGIAVIFLAALGGYLVWAGKVAGGKPRCETCNREVLKGSLFLSADAKGVKRRSCCPRCGLRSVLENGGQALEGTNFATGKMIPAGIAVYLEGSDIMECCAGSGFRAEDGAYSDVQYDRCMPSLIAFSTREEAELVRREHGGQILSFGEARQSVARQLGRSEPGK